MARKNIKLELLPCERAALLQWTLIREVRSQLEALASSDGIESIIVSPTILHWLASDLTHAIVKKTAATNSSSNSPSVSITSTAHTTVRSIRGTEQADPVAATSRGDSGLLPPAHRDRCTANHHRPPSRHDGQSHSLPCARRLASKVVAVGSRCE
jgi:hypothetical protein